MIHVLSLSPAIDKVYFIDNFHNGGLYRVENPQISAGGKGINVARVLSLLGEKPYISGFKAGNTGNWISSQIQKLGIETSFIELEGESRTNINIIDREREIETEVLERGPIVSQQKYLEFMQNFVKTLANTDILVCSGGLPLGISEDFYAQLIKLANEKGIKTLLDAGGKILEIGIESVPFLVKPNKRELSTLVNSELKSIDDVISACEIFINKGTSAVAVSLGADGAVLVTRNSIYKVETPNIMYKNAIGSGDSMVAGIVAGIYNGMSMNDSFLQGVACGVSNAEFEEIGMIDFECVHRHINNIKIINEC